MRKLARFLSYKLIRILDSIKPRTKKETRGEGWRGDGALHWDFVLSRHSKIKLH